MPARKTIGFVALVATLLSPRAAPAQQFASRSLPEPLLIDTPWGDFPLERVRSGARLRLTSPGRQRIEVQLASLRDSTLDIRSPNGDSLPPLTFADLRSFREVEVRALRRWSETPGKIGAVVGTVLGAAAGFAVHNARGRSAHGKNAVSLTEDVAIMSGAGFYIGGLAGRGFTMHARWRPVTIP